MAALLVAAALGTAGPAPAGAAAPVAQPGPPISTAGPLFFPSLLGLGPTLRLPHYCSGSVVHSASRDLVLTAAHCVFGTGLATEFAPGFADGATPFGVWTVTRAYVDRRWLTAHDPATTSPYCGSRRATAGASRTSPAASRWAVRPPPGLR